MSNQPKKTIKIAMLNWLARKWRIGFFASIVALIGSPVAYYLFRIPVDQIAVAVAVPTLVLYVMLRIFQFITVMGEDHTDKVEPSLEEIHNKNGGRILFTFGVIFIIGILCSVITILSAILYWALGAHSLLGISLLTLWVILISTGVVAVAIVFILMHNIWGRFCLGLLQSAIDRSYQIPMTLSHVFNILFD